MGVISLGEMGKCISRSEMSTVGWFFLHLAERDEYGMGMVV